MRISASSVFESWRKHPILCSVLSLLLVVYAAWVVYFTTTNGVEELGNALLMPVPVLLFFFFISAFPFWAVNHPTLGWVFLIAEFILFLLWGFVCVRRQYRPRVFALGLLVFAAINLTLNFVFPNWPD
jgi:hypothetical protein